MRVRATDATYPRDGTTVCIWCGSETDDVPWCVWCADREQSIGTYRMVVGPSPAQRST